MAQTPGSKRLLREIAEYAMSLSGACQSCSSISDYRESPKIVLAHALWGDFLEEHGDNVRIPVYAARLGKHRKKYPTIRKSDWMERDGHISMDVPLDGSVPLDAMKSFVDEAHAIIMGKLAPEDRFLIELGERPYDESSLLDILIERYDFKKHKAQIRKLVKPAVMLRTMKSTEVKIEVGSTKIGGYPDLSPKAEWPVYSNGKPLAFLAQIDLKEIAATGIILPGLPTSGLLSFFSVWGWQEKNDCDPKPPEDGTWTNQESSGWNVLLYSGPRVKRERRKSPRGLKTFKAAAVTPTPILTLPNHWAEPAMVALKWDHESLSRYDDLLSAFHSVQMAHLLRSNNSNASHHRLGGYASFQQEYPDNIPKKHFSMFLQMGTDGKSGMMWSDGGELTFYADLRGIEEGRIESIWGTCQGG